MDAIKHFWNFCAAPLPDFVQASFVAYITPFLRTRVWSVFIQDLTWGGHVPTFGLLFECAKDRGVMACTHPLWGQIDRGEGVSFVGMMEFRDLWPAMRAVMIGAVANNELAPRVLLNHTSQTEKAMRFLAIYSCLWHAMSGRPRDLDLRFLAKCIICHI